MTAHSNAPIIVKRKKVTVASTGHGGAWKVAYADFVTAMMAFFLLMWLLNATTEKQRKGIADYFSPTIPVNRVSGGGSNSFGGSDIFAENDLARIGNGASQRHPTEANMARGDTGTDTTRAEADGAAEEKAEAETKALEDLAKMLSARSGESMVSQDLARHIITRVTDEGLIVEIHDLPGIPLFQLGTDEPTHTMRGISAATAEIFALVLNKVAVNGFVGAQPIVIAENPAWDISQARADRVRRLLIESGLAGGRFDRVSGFADRRPVTINPMAPRNNRVELILLRKYRR